MKKIILPLFILFSFAGCAKKKPWTKDALVNDCLKNFYKKNEKEKIFSGMQIPLLCNCMSEKLVAKYKSDDESSKDQAGVSEITQDCVKEMLPK